MILSELFELPRIHNPKVQRHMYEVEQDVGGRKITFIAMNNEYDEDDRWRIDFAEHLDADVDEPFVSTMTGKGKEFEVFSFVIACAKDFIAKKDPKIIELRSDKKEPGRAPLYARLAKKFGAGYEISHTETERHNITVLTKRT